MKKRYYIYIGCVLVVFLLIFQLEIMARKSLCGIPGCNDKDTSLLYLILCIIPLLELIIFFKKNIKRTNVIFLIILIFFGGLFFIEKINYNESNITFVYYNKCLVSYNCKCNNNDKCECMYCKDYNNEANECNSEKIQCNKEWLHFE